MRSVRRGDVSATLLRFAIERLESRLSAMQKEHLRNVLSPVIDLDADAFGIRLYADSDIERTTRAASCAKEPKTVSWLRSQLRPGDVFYDVGANVGAYSLYAAVASGLTATVYAFEPSFVNFHQLCRNVLLNRCESNVIPLLMPLSNTTGLDRFHYRNLTTGGSLHSFAQAIDYRGEQFEPSNSLAMVGFCLDDFVAMDGVEAPTLLKIDVDGRESEILQGAKRTLAGEKLRSVLVEVNEALSDPTSAILRTCYEAGLTPMEKHRFNDQMFNYVFSRSQKPLQRCPGPEDVPVTWRRESGKRPSIT